MSQNTRVVDGGCTTTKIKGGYPPFSYERNMLNILADYEPTGKNILKASDRVKIQHLLDRHGNITLQQLLDSLPVPSGFVCPKCNATGRVTRQYDAYPRGLPDSGWATDMRTHYVKCDACAGEGYTAKQLVPNMVQQGWKET